MLRLLLDEMYEAARRVAAENHNAPNQTKEQRRREVAEAMMRVINERRHPRQRSV
jgi:hypothetical protein